MSDLTTLRDWARKREALEHLPAPERALWTQIADEIDAYLHRDEVVDLFGEVAMEPERGGPVPLGQCIDELAHLHREAPT